MSHTFLNTHYPTYPHTKDSRDPTLLSISPPITHALGAKDMFGVCLWIYTSILPSETEVLSAPPILCPGKGVIWRSGGGGSGSWGEGKWGILRFGKECWDAEEMWERGTEDSW